jgi:hypothetical protein
MSFDVYTSLIKMFNEFHESSDGVNLTYDIFNFNLQKIREKYDLDDIAGKRDDFSKSVNLLFWLSKNCYHNGNFDFKREFNSINLLEYSFQKGKEYGINCKALSAILTDCLLSLGLIARTIFICPFSIYDEDNHVITHVYINELKKWIMLDPTFNCYVMDKDKNPLNIFEIRELLANQEYIIFNKEIKYNDEKKDDDSQDYKEYLAKDIFYFQTFEKSCFYDETYNRILHVSPKAYDIKKREILNIEYRIKKQGDSDFMQKWLKNTEEYKYLYLSTVDLLKKP